MSTGHHSTGNSASGSIQHQFRFQQDPLPSSPYSSDLLLVKYRKEKMALIILGLSIPVSTVSHRLRS